MVQKKWSVNSAISRANANIHSENFLDAGREFDDVLRKFPSNARAKKGLDHLGKVTRKLCPPLNQNVIQNLFDQFAEGKIDQVLKSSQLYTLAYPDVAVLHNLVAACWRAQGNLESAVASCKKAIAADPNFAEAYNNMAIIYRDSCEYEKARVYGLKAVELRPDVYDYHRTMALVLMESDRQKEATDHLERALDLKSDSAELYSITAANFKELGQFDLAKSALIKATRIDPSYIPAFCALADMDKYERSDPLFTKLTDFVRSPNTSETNKMDIFFALAKMHDDLGDFDISFGYLTSGNNLFRRQNSFDIDSEKAFVEKLKSESQNLGKLGLTTNKNDSEKTPIFIVGMPRSGTTLVEQILASHSTVFGAGETEAVRLLTRSFLIRPHAGQELLEDSHVSKVDIEKFKSGYLSALEKYKFSQPIVTDKSLLNFLYIGLILAAFPDAKIINLKRDPRAVCWSIYKRKFRDGSHRYGYKLDELVAFYGLYVDIMDHWNTQFPNKIYEVNYERLTKNQETETRKLLEFCGLGWEENCLNFHTTRRAVKTSSMQQVRQKMYQGSSEAWRDYEKHLQPLIEGLKSIQ